MNSYGETYEGSFYQSREDELRVNIDSANAVFPSNALVEISNGCNHKCIFCYNTLMERKVSVLPLCKFENIIKQAATLGLQELGLYATGEPFLVKNLSEYIYTAKKYGIKRVYITSNGAMASIDIVKKCINAGLDSIKFSINASNKEDYCTIHGKDDWDTVLENVQNIYQYKLLLESSSSQKLQLLGSCVMTTLTGDIKNEHNKIFGKFFEDTLYAFAHNQAGRNNQYLNKFTLPEQIIDESNILPCEMLWNRLHVTAEGYLTCCCVDYEHDLVFSTLEDETLKQAWNNNLIKSIRLKHLEKKLSNLICYGCLTGDQRDYSPVLDTPENIKLRNNKNHRKVEEYIKRLDNI
jgi:molybdenum cofactor biosynthesis enzyme MoaA